MQALLMLLRLGLLLVVNSAGDLQGFVAASGASSSSSSSTVHEMFSRRVDPQDQEADPNRYTHTAHLRTPLGRFTHFQYDATKHPQTIHPHFDEGVDVTGCTQTSVQIDVEGAEKVAEAENWGSGWMFTMTPEHFSSGCPDARTGIVERRAPHYRRVTSRVSFSPKNDGKSARVVLTTEPASLHDMFSSLDMYMHSTQIMHEDVSLVQAKSGRRSQRRSLLSARYAGAGDGHNGEDVEQPRRRLHFGKIFKKAAKWVKKKVIRPAREAAKLLVTGKAENTWTKEFSLNWNYDKETGEALKSLPIHGSTACTSCFFHADAGYKVAMSIRHYKLNTALAEVYGDIQLELAMTNPGVAVDVNKLNKVMDAELFSVSFMLGPIPITVSLDLQVDLGLRFSVKEVGETPHIHAQGNGHIRFGKQYDRSNGLGWQPVNSHTIDLSFDSAGGTAHADLYLYANIVPTLHLHHVGSAMVTITPAVDVGLTAALPQASCDYKPLVDADHAVCQESEGTNNHDDDGEGHNDGCALGMTVTPSINVEMNLNLDIELWKKTIYKKTFSPMPLYQKTFDVHGFPKCLISSWSKKQNGGRRLELQESSAAAEVSEEAVAPLVYRSGGRVLFSGENQFNISGTIRDPNLKSPRVYLQQRGRDTQCERDCSGKGFCLKLNSSVPESFACVCQVGWTGDDCDTPKIRVDRLQVAGSSRANDHHPKPATCGHGIGVDADSKVASSSLQVCSGRTAPKFCASGDAAEMRRIDSAIEGVLKGYTESGYPCAAAMAELQCRLSFPAVQAIDLDPSDGKDTSLTLMPVSFQSCVDLFVPCLGEDAANEICSDASGDGIAKGWAGVAPRDSPWNTTALPSLFEAEVEANKDHRKCVLAPSSGMQGCPSREGKMVHVNTDVWNNVSQIDSFIFEAVATAKQEQLSPECASSRRTQLCASQMPLCNEYGNPIKLRFSECLTMVEGCPDIAAKDRIMYGLPSSGGAEESKADRMKYAAAVCSDNSDFFTRNFVGAHPVTCGYEAVMPVPGSSGSVENEVAVPWNKDVSVVAPVAVLGGVLCGAFITILFTKLVVSRKTRTAGTVVENPAVGVSLEHSKDTASDAGEKAHRERRRTAMDRAARLISSKSKPTDVNLQPARVSRLSADSTMQEMI